jgi:hypothetical protein
VTALFNLPTPPPFSRRQTLEKNKLSSCLPVAILIASLGPHFFQKGNVTAVECACHIRLREGKVNQVRLSTCPLETKIALLKPSIVEIALY